VISNNCVDVFNPKVVQSTMGSLIRLNIFYTSLESYLDEVSGKTKVYGTLMDGKNIYEFDLDNSAIIIIGNESNGISNNLKRFITNKITVPTFPDKAKRSAESLNASVATAIVCAEFRRQYK